MASVVYENYEEIEFLPCCQQQHCLRIAEIGVNTVLEKFDELVSLAVSR
jgi:hypothetical protein